FPLFFAPEILWVLLPAEPVFKTVFRTEPGRLVDPFLPLEGGPHAPAVAAAQQYDKGNEDRKRAPHKAGCGWRIWLRRFQCNAGKGMGIARRPQKIRSLRVDPQIFL